MDRKLLADILDKSSGLDKKGEDYLAADEHRASVYLGGSSSTTVLTEIVRLTLHETHLEAEAKDRTIHYVTDRKSTRLRGPRESGPGGRTGF